MQCNGPFSPLLSAVASPSVHLILRLRGLGTLARLASHTGMEGRVFDDEPNGTIQPGGVCRRASEDGLLSVQAT